MLWTTTDSLSFGHWCRARTSEMFPSSISSTSNYLKISQIALVQLCPQHTDWTSSTLNKLCRGLRGAGRKSLDRKEKCVFYITQILSFQMFLCWGVVRLFKRGCLLAKAVCNCAHVHAKALVHISFIIIFIITFKPQKTKDEHCITSSD